MLKKFSLIGLVLLSIIFFAACNQVAGAENEEENNEIEHVQLEGFVFEYRGSTINLNQNMADILANIGDPLNIHETPSCAFYGMDRIFMFPGVQFHTYPVDDNDFLQIISIWDDSITTYGGIRLGDSWDRVVELYGTNYIVEFQMRTFVLGNTTLSFFVEDGVVIEIAYGLKME